MDRVSLDRHLEPDWVDDSDDERDDEPDPDQWRDRREDEATEDAYDRWIESHSWWGQ